MLGKSMVGGGSALPMTGLLRAEKRAWFTGDHAPSQLEGYVCGLRPTETWFMAQADGTMSSRNDAGLGFSTDAIGQSIFNMAGSTAFLIGANSEFLNATFPGNGTASISIASTANAMRADGFMAGSTVVSGILTETSIAAAVLAAAASSPIASNIKQVNGAIVHGDGHAGSEWGP